MFNSVQYFLSHTIPIYRVGSIIWCGYKLGGSYQSIIWRGYELGGSYPKPTHEGLWFKHHMSQCWPTCRHQIIARLELNVDQYKVYAIMHMLSCGSHLTCEDIIGTTYH